MRGVFTAVHPGALRRHFRAEPHSPYRKSRASPPPSPSVATRHAAHNPSSARCRRPHLALRLGSGSSRHRGRLQNLPSIIGRWPRRGNSSCRSCVSGQLVRPLRLEPLLLCRHSRFQHRESAWIKLVFSIERVHVWSSTVLNFVFHGLCALNPRREWFWMEGGGGQTVV